ncbi:hypothetical protein DSECCO2_275610 [anaerobic digester metagenome]
MKDYREKEIKYLYICYMLLFLYWSTNAFSVLAQSIAEGWDRLFSIVDVVAIASIVSLLSFVLDSIISSNTKDKLVGLLFIPRAGATFFSRLTKGEVVDDRFLKEEAEARYAEIITALPKNKKEKLIFENAQWYKIYMKYQEKGSVAQAQKDYLLCRDLFVDTIAFMVMYLLSVVVFGNIVRFSTDFLVSMLTVATLTNIATHKKMNRFVNNVIAIDIALPKQ